MGHASPCLPQILGAEVELGLVPAPLGWALGRCCWVLPPGEEEDADRGKGPFPTRVCWLGVAQTRSPEGGWGGCGQMPNRTSQLPGTPQPCPDCHSLWKRHLKPWPLALEVTLSPLGMSPQQPPQQLRCPGDVISQGSCQRSDRSWQDADPRSGPGRMSHHQHPLYVPLVGSWSCSWPNPHLHTAGAAGTASPRKPPPLSAFQDKTMASPAHPLSSAPSTTSEVMEPCTSLCQGWRRQRVLSTGQDQAIPVPDWGRYPQPSASP